MNLEKLGILVFLKQFQQVEGIKKHLMTSFKELLLATSASLELTNQITSENQILKKAHSLEHALTLMNHLVKSSAERLDVSDEGQKKANIKKIKHDIISSIILVVDDELEAVSEGMDNGKREKIEALMTVRNVFIRQLQEERYVNKTENDVVKLDNIING